MNDTSHLLNRKRQTKDLNDSQLMEQGLWEPGNSQENSGRTRNGLTFNALPAWLQDNSYIQQGYRPPSPSVKECVKTIFQVHTETGNIWSHLIGCVAFIVLSISFLSQSTPMYQFQDKIIFGIFFAGVITCFFLSSTYHTLRCHSPGVGKLFHKLDYVGIAILIMASFVPWLHYGFYCHDTARHCYMGVTFFLGLMTIIFSLFDKFATPAYRPIRAGLFVLFGLSGVVPGIHYLILYGWHHALTKASMGWLILMGFLYILGALFYAQRVPEKWFVGTCDIWSHQIFHVLVVAAAFVHFHGIHEMAINRRRMGGCIFRK